MTAYELASMIYKHYREADDASWQNATIIAGPLPEGEISVGKYVHITEKGCVFFLDITSPLV